VSIVQIPAKRVATIRFSGRLTEKSRAKNTASLLRWMEAEGLEQQAEPRWAGYKAPWALPPLRRNEVLIDIAAP
jgi:DNA gyrase inhibitor GyrI